MTEPKGSGSNSNEQTLVRCFESGWRIAEIAKEIRYPIDEVISVLRRLKPEIFGQVVYVPPFARRESGVFTAGKTYLSWKVPSGGHWVLDDRDCERTISPRVETVFTWS